MRRQLAIAAAVGASALAVAQPAAATPPRPPKAGVIQVALGRDARVYQRGHRPGWHLEVADFQNVTTGQAAFGDPVPGWPAHPAVVVTVPHTADRRGLDIWTAPRQPWSVAVVVYAGPRGQVGLGQFFDAVAPIATTPTTPLFTIPTTG